jgi:hypothetical protein
MKIFAYEKGTGDLGNVFVELHALNGNVDFCVQGHYQGGGQADPEYLTRELGALIEGRVVILTDSEASFDRVLCDDSDEFLHPAFRRAGFNVGPATVYTDEKVREMFTKELYATISAVLS